MKGNIRHHILFYHFISFLPSKAACFDSVLNSKSEASLPFSIHDNSTDISKTQRKKPISKQNRVKEYIQREINKQSKRLVLFLYF